MAVENWWREFFGSGSYPLPSLAADWEGKTAQEALALKRALKLPRGARILDVGCGVGRHAIALAKLGYEVTGLDFSPRYLSLARAAARKARVNARWARGDMRALPFRGEFDGAVNLFSSFGYFAKASDDLKTVRGIRRALVPGGRFVIDNADLDFVKRHFSSQSWAELSDGTLLLEKREPPGAGNVLVGEWLFVSPSGKRTRLRSAIRGYNRKALTALLERAGFKTIRPLPPLAGKLSRVVLLATT